MEGEKFKQSGSPFFPPLAKTTMCSTYTRTCTYVHVLRTLTFAGGLSPTTTAAASSAVAASILVAPGRLLLLEPWRHVSVVVAHGGGGGGGGKPGQSHLGRLQCTN